MIIYSIAKVNQQGSKLKNVITSIVLFTVLEKFGIISSYYWDEFFTLITSIGTAYASEPGAPPAMKPDLNLLSYIDP